MTDLLDRLQKSKLVRFGAVGGAGMFVNMGALALAKMILPANGFVTWSVFANVLTALRMGWVLPHLNDIIAWLFGFAVAVTFTWWGNRTFTFHDQKSEGHKGMLTEWARFVATNSFGAAANFAVFFSLVYFAPWPFSLMRADLRAYPALAVGVLVGLIFNFTLSKKLVFRGGVTPPPAPPSRS